MFLFDTVAKLTSLSSFSFKGVYGKSYSMGA